MTDAPNGANGYPDEYHDPIPNRIWHHAKNCKAEQTEICEPECGEYVQVIPEAQKERMVCCHCGATNCDNCAMTPGDPRPTVKPMPCPWCGETPEFSIKTDVKSNAVLYCNGLRCPVLPMVAHEKTRAAAIRAWNRRKP